MAPAEVVPHRSGDGRPRITHARAAAILFAAAVVVAVPLYLIRGNDQWFFLDEYDFLAGRSATSLDDLLRPHNEHWVTLPILAYRVMWHFVGLRSYVPYQAMTIALHLTAATLLWILMRRARVQPFVAAIVGAAFVLLGAGRSNIVWAFQISFTGALVCGLAHLLLADHDGGLDRRDALGLAFGVCGLMCSGVAVTMTVVVGLCVLVRRGWRMAAYHVVPLAVLYLAWWLAFGRGTTQAASGALEPLVEFVAITVGNGFDRIGQVTGVGIALGALLVVGLVVAWRTTPAGERRQRAAPIALLAGALVFATITAVGRADAFGPDAAKGSRYVYMFAAMVLPALAVAADAVIRRWRIAMPLIFALLVIGIPGNLVATRAQGVDRFLLGAPDVITGLAHSPYARRVPRSLHPQPTRTLAREVTVGWLADGAASGRIPAPTNLPAGLREALSLGLTLRQLPASSASTCAPLTAPVERVVRRGEPLVFARGNLNVQLVAGDGSASDPVRYQAGRPARLESLAGPLRLRLSGPALGGTVSICA